MITKLRNPIAPIIVIAMVMWFTLAACSVVGAQRLEPGLAAVKIDYANGGKRTDIPSGGVLQYNPITERIAEYPIGQQSLVMVRNPKEGQAQADDSVEVSIRGIPIHIDTTAFWRIDANHVADMFVLRPNVPLIGKTLNDGIDGIVVRRLVRGAMQDAGALFESYLDPYQTKRTLFVKTVAQSLGCPTGDLDDPLAKIDALSRTADPNTVLGKEYIICDKFQIGEVYLEADQQKAVSGNANAQTAVTTSLSLKLAAENTAAAAAAPIKANAQAEADGIALRETALADAPHVLAYDVAMAQANHPPLVQGSAAMVQLPASTLATPTTSQTVLPTQAAKPTVGPTPSR